MSNDAQQASAVRTWATVLGFLAALMIVLGGVAFAVQHIAHGAKPRTAAQMTERH